MRLVDLKTPPLPEKVRRDAGFYLNELQDGVILTMPISRRIDTIGPRVFELRFSDKSGDWRIIYRNDPTEIVVIDRFHKTTQVTPKAVIDRCRARLAKLDATQ